MPQGEEKEKYAQPNCSPIWVVGLLMEHIRTPRETAH